MTRLRGNTEVLRDLGWWHWTATIPLLVLALAGSKWAHAAAVGLCVVAATYYIQRINQLRPYPIQVRLAYIGVLLCGMLPGMNWFNWVPLIGTTAMVFAGYCPLLRVLTLAPWNRARPLCVADIGYALVRMPCAGGLIGLSSASPSGACCSATQSHSPTECSLSCVPVFPSHVTENDHANVI